MGVLETAGSISAVEKLGWLGLLGGFFVACVKVVQWCYNFQAEHDAFKKHLLETESLTQRFLVVEESTKIAKEERKEIIAELRGLRAEINNVLKLMVRGHQHDG